MIKKCFLAATLFCCGFFGIVNADGLHVPVEQNQRVYNINNQRCLWCSIEVLAKWAHIDSLSNLSKEYEGPALIVQAEYVLKKRSIEHKINAVGNTGLHAIYEFLVIPCQYEHRGVAVILKNSDILCHAINLVHYDRVNKKIMIIDNSDPNLVIRKMDWDEFHRRWTGAAVIIYNNPDPFPKFQAVWD